MPHRAVREHYVLGTTLNCTLLRATGERATRPTRSGCRAVRYRRLAEYRAQEPAALGTLLCRVPSKVNALAKINKQNYNLEANTGPPRSLPNHDATDTAAGRHQAIQRPGSWSP